MNDAELDEFVHDAEPRLRRALLGAVGTDRVEDAVGEALADAVENWATVSVMVNPVGYLFRVGRLRDRTGPRAA